MRQEKPRPKSYVPFLKDKNPIKEKKVDWWDEMCKAHGAKNHWAKKKKRT